MSDLETHAAAIRTAIRETSEAMAVLTPEQIITKRHEYAALLAHLQRLQDLENAVLGMVTARAKGE